MCGIIGITGRYPATPRLVTALKKLEYRGYDSAGVATLFNGKLDRRRASGKITNLEAVLDRQPLDGTVGIGHTRWATHGSPSEVNAHPHTADGVCVVHNGIIENYVEIRSELEVRGLVFETETDTEVIAKLVSYNLSTGMKPQAAVQAAVSKFRGAYGIALIFSDYDNLMIGARMGSPLVIGVGEGEMYLGSDALALSQLTKDVVYLEEGDLCVLTKTSHEIFDKTRKSVVRAVQTVETEEDDVGKGNYAHYMLKEIYEQPKTLKRTLETYTHPATGELTLPKEAMSALDATVIGSVHMISCGTAHYSTRIGEYWLEQIAGLTCKCDIASEFRYRRPVMNSNDLAVFVSQSGETADTLAALRYAKSQGVTTIAIVNVPTSTIAREADIVLPTRAGPEIGVASTKAFTSQLLVLLILAVLIGHQKNVVDDSFVKEVVEVLARSDQHVEAVLELENDIQKTATLLEPATSAFFLGRGLYYPLALEGALKLKEISYIHAEGFASGELKHGPIALITDETPIVFVAPNDELFEKSLSNLQEVAARKGPVILISDQDGVRQAGKAPLSSIVMPDVKMEMAPITYAIALQLLAYHTAVLRGTDVDQPRNLAKSVTVE